MIHFIKIWKWAYTQCFDNKNIWILIKHSKLRTLLILLITVRTQVYSHLCTFLILYTYSSPPLWVIGSFSIHIFPHQKQYSLTRALEYWIVFWQLVLQLWSQIFSLWPVYSCALINVQIKFYNESEFEYFWNIPAIVI